MVEKERGGWFCVLLGADNYGVSQICLRLRVLGIWGAGVSFPVQTCRPYGALFRMGKCSFYKYVNPNGFEMPWHCTGLPKRLFDTVNRSATMVESNRMYKHVAPTGLVFAWGNARSTNMSTLT
ncbi:MAG: hypothetical protein RL092_341, partial [Bacteroidota bacterium]